MRHSSFNTFSLLYSKMTKILLIELFLQYPKEIRQMLVVAKARLPHKVIHDIRLCILSIDDE